MSTLDAIAVRIDDGSTVVVGTDAAQVSEVVRLAHGLCALVILRPGVSDE